jgi:hypothetical protein
MGIKYLEELHVNDKVILKWIPEILYVGVRISLSWLRVASSGDHC